MRDIPYFAFWCHKVIPLVYDESLSYYEVLCKTREKLNEVIQKINEIPDYIDQEIRERLSDEHIKELLGEFVRGIEAAISSNNEGDNTNSSADYAIGDLLWLNDKLYEAIREIDAGDTFIIGTNIKETNFEDLFKSFADEIKYDICPNDDGGNTTASESRTKGDWLWLNDDLYIVTRDIERGNAYIITGENTNLKKISIYSESEVIYYPNDELLSLHGKISDYSQIVTEGDYHIYTPQIETISIEHVE